ALWARTVGSTTWTKVATDTTDATGHYYLSTVVNRAADYQMRWAGDTSYAAALSPALRLTTPPRTPVAIDLHKNKTTVVKGAPLMLYGHTTAGTAGLAGLTVSYSKRMPS